MAKHKYIVNISVYCDNGLMTEVIDMELHHTEAGPEQAIACAALQAIWSIEKPKSIPHEIPDIKPTLLR